jgi:hypothetical protein
VVVFHPSEFPDNALFHSSLRPALGYVGGRELEKGDRTAARLLLEQAIRYYRLALDVNPDSPLYGTGLPRLVKDLDGAGGPAAR